MMFCVYLYLKYIDIYLYIIRNINIFLDKKIKLLDFDFDLSIEIIKEEN